MIHIPIVKAIAITTAVKAKMAVVTNIALIHVTVIVMLAGISSNITVLFVHVLHPYDPPTSIALKPDPIHFNP